MHDHTLPVYYLHGLSFLKTKQRLVEGQAQSPTCLHCPVVSEGAVGEQAMATQSDAIHSDGREF